MKDIHILLLEQWIVMQIGTKQWLKNIGVTNIAIDDPKVRPYDVDKWLVDIRFKIEYVEDQINNMKTM